MKKIFFLMVMILILPISTYAISDSGKYSYSNYHINWKYDDGVLSLDISENSLEKIIPFNSQNLFPWIMYKNDTKKIIINEGIDVIGSHAFENYPNLEEVEFPKSMGGEIADYAFYNCPKLTHVDLPIGFSKIGDYAFYNTGIKEIELPIFVNWTEEHSFNEDTNIIKLSEKEGIIDAGTGGEHRYLGEQLNEGHARDNTCYNVYYWSLYYDDTSYWRLDNEGTLTVWGTDLKTFYASRQPWGCYNPRIKKIVLNDDKTGILTKTDSDNKNKKLERAMYGIYVNKPVEEIMNNRIKTLSSHLYCDCREDCVWGMRNLDTLVLNRGIDNLDDHQLESHGTPGHPKDIYISKYLKKISTSSIMFIGSNEQKEKNIHFEVSFEDYKNNNYDYNKLSSYYYHESPIEIISNNNFINHINTTVHGTTIFYGNIINDIDEYYVSINDNTAPKTIEVDGKTYYLYDTYMTNKEGIAKVSIPNNIYPLDDLEYYVKEVKAPTGYDIDKNAYKIDMSKDTLNIQVSDKQLKNPETNGIIVTISIIISIILIALIINKASNKKAFL